MSYESMTTERLRELFERHNRLYYDEGRPEISDAEYDALKEEYARRVGVIDDVPAAAGKVKLPYVMASLNKPKSLAQWSSAHPPPYYLSDKLDGISVMLIAERNKLRLLSRGNGAFGQDISHVLPHINHYVRKNNNSGGIDFVARGELIMKKSAFEKFEHEYKTARNLVASVVTAKKPNKSVLRHFDIVYYALYEYEHDTLRATMETQYELLDNVVDNVVWHIRADAYDEAELKEVLWRRKREGEYEVDGIVVVEAKYVGSASDGAKVENPKHAVAFKTNERTEGAETRVVSVEWRVSKDYRAKPTVVVEPVQLQGVTIRKATGFNAAFIIKNKLNKGSVVRIVRSGDVIPYIASVLTPSAAAAQPPFDVELRGQEYFATRRDAVNLFALIHFFKKMNIAHLQEGTLRRLSEAGFDSIQKIVEMTREEAEQVDGFQSTMARKVVEEVKRGVRDATLVQWMSASNYFQLLSDKKLALILRHLPRVTTQPFTSRTRDEMMRIKGVDTKTIDSFEHGLPLFLRFMRDLRQDVAALERRYHATLSNNNSSANANNANYYVFSGFRDAAYKQQLESQGHVVEDAISARTTHLVVKDKSKVTAKVKKALEKGIQIVQR